MYLSDLFNNYGSRQSSKRVGRGIGSGKGKTSGSGHKGQKARSGVALRFFEGGQTPLIKRLPKRGFTPLKKKDIDIISFKSLSVFLNDSVTLVDHEFLLKVGLIKSIDRQVKLLGDGELSFKCSFKLNACSDAAKQVVEKNGGEFLLV